CFLLEFSRGVEPMNEECQAIEWGLGQSGQGQGVDRRSKPEACEEGTGFVRDGFEKRNTVAYSYKCVAELRRPSWCGCCGALIFAENHAQAQQFEGILSAAARRLGENLAHMATVAIEQKTGAFFDLRDYIFCER